MRSEAKISNNTRRAMAPCGTSVLSIVGGAFSRSNDNYQFLGTGKPDLRFTEKNGEAMDRSEEYRKLAADAFRLAEDARTDRDRAAWLRLARAWLSLLPRRSDKETAFDKKVQEIGTGQDSSQSSH